MTPEEVKALIEASLKEHTKSIEELLDPTVTKLADTVREYMGKIDTRIDGLEAAKAPEATKKDTKEPSATDSRLSLLEQQLKDYQEREAKSLEEAKQRRYEDALGKTVEPFSPKFRNEAIKFFKDSLGDVSEDEQRGWLSKSGKTLDEHAKEFFSSDFGKHLLPSQQASGAGTEPSAKGTKAASTDLGQDLMQAFL